LWFNFRLYYYGAYLHDSGALTVGATVASVSFLQKIYSPLHFLASLHTSVVEGLIMFENYFEHIDLPGEKSQELEEKQFPPLVVSRGAIRVVDVSFSYHKIQPSTPVSAPSSSSSSSPTIETTPSETKSSTDEKKSPSSPSVLKKRKLSNKPSLSVSIKKVKSNPDLSSLTMSKSSSLSSKPNSRTKAKAKEAPPVLAPFSSEHSLKKIASLPSLALPTLEDIFGLPKKVKPELKTLQVPVLTSITFQVKPFEVRLFALHCSLSPIASMLSIVSGSERRNCRTLGQREKHSRAIIFAFV
jgi:ABC-type multidrug transport system fused ATPase/permease subunit